MLNRATHARGTSQRARLLWVLTFALIATGIMVYAWLRPTVAYEWVHTSPLGVVQRGTAWESPEGRGIEGEPENLDNGVLVRLYSNELSISYLTEIGTFTRIVSAPGIPYKYLWMVHWPSPAGHMNGSQISANFINHTHSGNNLSYWESFDRESGLLQKCSYSDALMNQPLDCIKSESVDGYSSDRYWVVRYAGGKRTVLHGPLPLRDANEIIDNSRTAAPAGWETNLLQSLHDKEEAYRKALGWTEPIGHDHQALKSRYFPER